MSRAKIQAALCAVLKDMGVEEPTVKLERPRDPSHGDVASNVAMTLARELERAPRQIAEEIMELLDLEAAGVEAVEIAGPGFLNFRLSSGVVASVLPEILACDESWGRSETGSGARVMVEFVSANPTGPLHIGHGRQAALGDAICSLLTWTGWDVHREFYYNDGGRQMELLALSVYARYLEHFGGEAEIPEGGYHGGYVAEIAERLADDVGEKYREGVSEEELDEIRAFAVRILRAEQDRDLNDFRVFFDEYYLESSLYSEGRVAAAIQALKDTGLVYEHEGATWLKTTEFGDQKDRVMVRSNGLPTYFLPDVAYHLHKWQRGFHRVINVQGSDHHGTVDRVRGGTQALGLPEGYPEYVLHQMVRVTRDGQEVKFSKRAGSALSLRELYDEVGVDVTRYFFQMRKPDAQMLFDVDAALDQSDKNPVYKVQYAHARMCSIFAKAGIAAESIEAGATDLSVLDHELERELVKNLGEFTEVIERSARQSTPHTLCEYLEQTAGSTNGWYHAGNPSRNPELAVLAEDPELRRARLVLARAVQIVLRNGLAVLGISAPTRMDRAVLDEEP
ncbi:MAG: arginine--tRNA ligase [Gemmatimonadetes bacterium]|nr:arginine--tRNA ligase [Gemmatimonadota bacterium]